jgi:hypothetical protein
MAADFLTLVYSKDDHEGCDLIIERVKGNLRKYQFAEIDELLKLGDTEQLSDAKIICLLETTGPANLIYRSSFYERAFRAITVRRGYVVARKLLKDLL